MLHSCPVSVRLSAGRLREDKDDEPEDKIHRHTIRTSVRTA